MHPCIRASVYALYLATRIQAPQSYSVGEHVYITYGPKANADLATSYAFGLEDNPFDIASVEVPQYVHSEGRVAV